MRPVFLKHLTAADSGSFTALPVEGDHTIYFLPDKVLDYAVTTSPELNNLHSNLCLGRTEVGCLHISEI